MPKQIAPSWSWVFTCNNYEESDIVALVALFKKFNGMKYFLRREVGEKCGTPHLQGSIWQTRRMAPKPGQKTGRRLQFRPLPMFKIERHVKYIRMDKSPQCNIDYCGGTGDHEGKFGFGSAIHNLTPEWYPKSWYEAEKALKAQESELAIRERNAQWLLNYGHLLDEWNILTNGGRWIECDICDKHCTQCHRGPKWTLAKSTYVGPFCWAKLMGKWDVIKLMDEIVERIAAFYCIRRGDADNEKLGYGQTLNWKFDFTNTHGAMSSDTVWREGEPFWYPFDSVWEYIKTTYD